MYEATKRKHSIFLKLCASSKRSDSKLDVRRTMSKHPAVPVHMCEDRLKRSRYNFVRVDVNNRKVLFASCEATDVLVIGTRWRPYSEMKHPCIRAPSIVSLQMQEIDVRSYYNGAHIVGTLK